MRIRVVVPVVALTVAVGVAVAGVDAVAPPAKHAVRARYSTADVLEYLMFSKGRVVADHPELAEPRQTPTEATDEQSYTVAETASHCVGLMDGEVGPALSSAFNAGDPQRLDGAIARVDGVVRRWMDAPFKLDAPCPDPPFPPKYGGEYHEPSGKGWWQSNGYGASNYVLIGQDFYAVGVTVGGVLVISALGLVGFVVVLWIAGFWVPVLPSYVFENKPTELDHQIALAKIARALR